MSKGESWHNSGLSFIRSINKLFTNCFIKINLQFYLKRVKELIFYTSSQLWSQDQQQSHQQSSYKCEWLGRGWGGVPTLGLLNQECQNTAQQVAFRVIMMHAKFKNYFFLNWFLGSTCFRDHIQKDQQYIFYKNAGAQSVILKLNNS